jgi:hypothetical protein
MTITGRPVQGCARLHLCGGNVYGTTSPSPVKQLLAAYDIAVKS